MAPLVSVAVAVAVAVDESYARSKAIWPTAVSCRRVTSSDAAIFQG
jgi:hypothetical protein